MIETKFYNSMLSANNSFKPNKLNLQLKIKTKIFLQYLEGEHVNLIFLE